MAEARHRRREKNLKFGSRRCRWNPWRVLLIKRLKCLTVVETIHKYDVSISLRPQLYD